MTKLLHEIRDPIHVFVRLDSQEREVLNSRPVQRLRNIHQLAMTYEVYPGATHKRFEHSLGVMELASRVFDVVTNTDNIFHAHIRDMIPKEPLRLLYWRKVLRMAALCHDVGHLPFSHAGEKKLLPARWSHERMTHAIIHSKEMKEIWSHMEPPLTPEHISRLALGVKEYKAIDPKVEFDVWQTVLSEIITGDSFGVDRMDYLLRDSRHSGVVYGVFDHNRLIDCLRLIPKEDGSDDPSLGVEEGGLQSAVALGLARYFMFDQLYFHHVRRSYDLHLVDFLKAWLGKVRGQEKFPIDVDGFIGFTDNEVSTALRKAAARKGSPGHDAARRIIHREHFRRLYRPTKADRDASPDQDPGERVFRAAKKKFGARNVRRDFLAPKGGGTRFPVLMYDGRIEASVNQSEALERIVPIGVDYVFVSPEIRDQAVSWLEQNREKIIKNEEGE
jgi:HD superfamily phosphohydrolase